MDSLTVAPFDPESPPPWTVREWVNCDRPLTLSDFRGRVVCMTVFQTHCHGSRRHALPQAVRMAQAFREHEVAIVGLNSPFESQASQSPESVRAFLQANRITFPVGIDATEVVSPPRTMEAYAIQGTPAILIYDRQGRLRRHYLGGIDDIRIAAEIMAFLMEGENTSRDVSMAVERILSVSLAAAEPLPRRSVPAPAREVEPVSS